MVPVVFYVVVAAARLDLGVLREKGWLFDMGASREPWYHFYTLYGGCGVCPGFRTVDSSLVDFKAVRWDVFWTALPTQLAL